MKKVYILICAILMILLVGCNDKTVNTEGTNKFDKIKSELSLIPKEYNINNADKDGYFVISNGEVKSKFEIIDKFVSDSQNEKPAFITIVYYSTNRKPIITKIVYDGIKYYGIRDDTRFTEEYREFEFKYLKVFEENHHKTYLLFNDKEISYAQYIKSIASSNSNDFIDHHFLCSYNN
ncbi:MAG: hypothetical protein ACREV6_11015 [Clostridium sp.]|uniref:hypothetical protein n=1 Tax=Clostridium sp. TaxID=1506 RepID=UPI003D6C7562